MAQTLEESAYRARCPLTIKQRVTLKASLVSGQSFTPPLGTALRAAFIFWSLSAVNSKSFRHGARPPSTGIFRFGVRLKETNWVFFKREHWERMRREK